MKKIAALVFGLFLTASMWAQTDSIGVYAVRGTVMERIEVLNYKQTKISASPIKSKAKLAFDGASSSAHFKGVATFRLYFNTPSPYDVAKYYMFTPSYTAKDFGVGKFDVKKGIRYLTTSSFSVIGGSTIGAGEAKGVVVQMEKIRDNVYEITVTGPAGEYCIMPVIQGLSGYTGVFDFTIK